MEVLAEGTPCEGTVPGLPLGLGLLKGPGLLEPPLLLATYPGMGPSQGRVCVGDAAYDMTVSGLCV